MTYLCASERVLMSSNRELIRFIKRKVSQWHDGGGACGSRHTCICIQQSQVSTSMVENSSSKGSTVLS